MKFSLRSVFKSALLATAIVAAPLAHAQANPGLPMWVIKDADTTIYVTGTVHMLPAELQWSSEKIEKAIKEAKELWLEIKMSSDVNQMAMESMPILMKYGVTSRPLKTLLTPEEYASFEAAIVKAGLPKETSMMLNMMKPWYATLVIGISPLLAAGFDPESGIDVKIAKLAETDGDPIKGLESIEDQLKVIAAGTEEEQLEGLRAVLKADPADTKAEEEKGRAAFEAWAKGDPEPTRVYFKEFAEASAKGPDPEAATAALDALLKNRNENWAVQIEKMMKGSGVHFIAVGAGHLVGPDSLFDRLKLRGIEASRY